MAIHFPQAIPPLLPSVSEHEESVSEHRELVPMHTQGARTSRCLSCNERKAYIACAAVATAFFAALRLAGTQRIGDFGDDTNFVFSVLTGVCFLAFLQALFCDPKKESETVEVV